METNSITFEAVDAPFNYSNETWALANLPKVRIASLMLKRDDTELTDVLDRMARSGAVPEMLEGMVCTRDHLKALVEMIDVALARSFTVLERLGYSPDCPPSEHTMQ